MPTAAAKAARGEVGFDPALLKVVVASDDLQLRAELAAFVRGLGCACVEAESSPAALELLTVDHGLNVLIADVNMSKIDGVELVQRVRRVRGASVFLGGILIAAGNDPELPVRALHAKASDLVLRPSIRENLHAAIMRVHHDFVEAGKPLFVRDDLQGQLNEVATAVFRLNQRLQEITRTANGGLTEEDEAEDGTGPIDRNRLVETVRRMIRDRKIRERFFRDARFGEPAWDILLDLTLAWLEGNAVSVSSVCIASGVPMSTAMRWINEMVEAELVERRTDPTDGRRNFVNIAPGTMQAMLRYLTAITRRDAQTASSAAQSAPLPPAQA